MEGVVPGHKWPVSVWSPGMSGSSVFTGAPPPPPPPPPPNINLFVVAVENDENLNHMIDDEQESSVCS